MSARLEPCVSIDFDSSALDEVVTKTKDWALMHGNYCSKEPLLTCFLI